MTRKNASSLVGPFHGSAAMGAVVVSILAVAICADAVPSHAGTASGQAERSFVVAAQTGPQIEIAKHKFSRPTLTVPAGTTVSWLNRDEDVHTVVSTNQVFKSAGLETGERYSYTFTKPGVDQYFCTLHPLLTGTIIVK